MRSDFSKENVIESFAKTGKFQKEEVVTEKEGVLLVSSERFRLNKFL